MLAANLYDLFDLFISHVGFDFEADPNSFESGANVLAQSQKSLQIDVAFDERFDFVDLDSPGSSVINDGSCQACRKRVKQIFAGIRALILSKQDRRFVSIQNELCLVLDILTSSVEIANLRAVVSTAITV